MIKDIKSTYLDLINFLKYPINELDPDRSVATGIKRILHIFIIQLPVLMILMAVINALEELKLVDLSENAVNEMMKESQIAIILLGVIVAPLWEELVFRAYLLLKLNLPYQITVLMVSITGEGNKIRFKDFAQAKWRKYFRVVVYLSAVIFAYIHIFNFDLTLTVILISPLLVSPQFLVGLMAAYIRVKHGLIWSILFHAFHNSVFIAMALLFINEIAETHENSTADYEIKIEQLAKNVTGTTSSYENSDSLYFEKISLERLFKRLLVEEFSTVSVYPPKKANSKINLVLKNKSSVQDNKTIVLDELKNIYQLTITYDSSNERSMELVISDSVLFMNHKSDIDNSNKVVTKRDSLIYENINLLQFAASLNKVYHLNINTDIQLADQYQFRLKRTDFEGVNQQLKQIYGLEIINSDLYYQSVLVEIDDLDE